MKKETLADKLAKKTFESAAFQKSWQVHMQAFGPILEPAFQVDHQARVHLTAALNKLSSRDIKGALSKLKGIEKACETDADRAAWLFFMGLCCELAGARPQMLDLYQQANQLEHRFYMPYLKIAKSAQSDGALDAAEENYRDALACLGDRKGDGRIKGSVYTNLASCLTMMHRLEEACEALELSKKLLPELPGRAAVEAIARAAMDDAAAVEALLAQVEQETPAAAEATRKNAMEILEGTHFHFHGVPFETRPLDEFWAWFLRERAHLEEQISGREYEAVIAALRDALKPLAPFMDREPEFAVMPMKGRYQLELADFYAAALHEVYEELILRMPAEIADTWDIIISH